MTKLLALITVLTFSSSLFALEFKSFGLKNELKELNEAQEAPKPAAAGTFSARKSRTNNESKPAKGKALRDLVSQKLLGLQPQKSNASDELSPLMVKISQLLANKHDQIGEEETAPLVLSHDIGGGVLNYSGFQWQRPFANFRMYVDRQVTMELGGAWIVHDNFIIEVDASTMLTSLKEADLIDITEDQIGAFAGISFRREYRYNHLAPTFLAGLQADYSKLFLPFLKFRPEHILAMPPKNFLRMSDKFTFNAGGAVNYPPTGGFSGRAGVLVSVAYERGLTLHSVESNGEPDSDMLLLGIESKTEKSVGAELQLQLDFFNLLKLTILSADLDYSYADKNITNLSFQESDRKVLDRSPAHYQEFKKLVQGRSDRVRMFKKNIISLEERIERNIESGYSFLLFGSAKKLGTEQVKIIMDGVEKVIFKHTSESVKFLQNLWSRIYGIVIHKLFNWDSGIKNAAQATKTMTVEFEHMEELGEGKVDSPDKFSVTLTQNFQAAKTHRWWHGLYRRESRRSLAKMTNLDKKYQKFVNNRTLRGPLEISSKIQILAPGLNHFNFLDENYSFALFKEICGNGRNCQKLLRRKYTDYTGHFHRYGIIDLMRFKSFIGSFFKRIRHYQDIYALFGRENVFMNGSFTATTRSGAPFTTYFKEGEFQGLGVIDTYIRGGVNRRPYRAPANITPK